MVNKSLLQPKNVGWILFVLSLTVFFIYHVWAFSAYENALYQANKFIP